MDIQKVNITRTDSGDFDFLSLVKLLDEELAIRDGTDNAFYTQFNSVDALTHCLTLSYRGKVIACGALKPFPNQSAEVKRMYTLPEFRGYGIATQILNALKEWAIEDGFTKLNLETGLKQPEALSLYRRCGFLQIPNYGPYEGISNSICFELKL